MEDAHRALLKDAGAVAAVARFDELSRQVEVVARSRQRDRAPRQRERRGSSADPADRRAGLGVPADPAADLRLRRGRRARHAHRRRAGTAVPRLLPRDGALHRVRPGGQRHDLRKAPATTPVAWWPWHPRAVPPTARRAATSPTPRRSAFARPRTASAAPPRGGASQGHVGLSVMLQWQIGIAVSPRIAATLLRGGSDGTVLLRYASLNRRRRSSWRWPARPGERRSRPPTWDPSRE